MLKMSLSKEEIDIKISQTEDYSIFNNKLNKKINDWESEKKYPKKYFMVDLLDYNPNHFYLWGNSGSGKTAYLKIWKKNKDKLNICLFYIHLGQDNLDLLPDKIQVYIIEIVKAIDEMAFFIMNLCK